MTSRDDLVLVHPPSVYDFRRQVTLWGPISDLVPSNPIFDMSPIGFTTIAEYLERHGHRVRIVNLAVRMLLDPEFDAEKMLASLDPAAFGIDLHWLPHAHGALEVAGIIKRIHPQTPVIMGGFSSSYFHEELISYPQTDYVIRGDSTEKPFLSLIEHIKSGAGIDSLKRVPNLSWKDAKGTPHFNPLTHVPYELDDVSIDYRFSVNAVVRDRKLLNNLPFAKWRNYPIVAALTCRGCTCNCTICGGSSFASAHFLGREKPAFRSPETVAQDIRRICRFSRGPVFVIGDIRQPGMQYARIFLKSIQGIQNQVVLEFFWPVDRNFMEEIAGAVPRFVVEFSPESHDPEVRRYSGKPYSNDEIETSIESILAAGCGRADIFFMSGLPGQTPRSVMKSIDYCGKLLKRFDGDERLKLFISPLAPFLDPGCLAYEKPGQYGYKKFCSTLEDHRRALLGPSWKYILSYETKWMNRDELVQCTYSAALRLNRLKAEFGQADREQSQSTEERILKAVSLMERIDKLVAANGAPQLQKELVGLRPMIEEANDSTVCEKTELDLPVAGMPFRVVRAAGLFIEDRVKNLGQRFR